MSEVWLALMLTAGAFKADPRLRWLPIDLTLLGALGTTLALIWRVLTTRETQPGEVQARCEETLKTLLLFALFAPSLMSADWYPYAVDKAAYLFTLTLLAAVAPIWIVRDEAGMRRFILCLAAAGILMAADAAANLFSGHVLLRVRAFGSDEIYLGRLTGIALLWGVLHFLTSEKVRVLPLLVAGAAGGVLLASGARGPSLSVLLAIAVVSVASGVRKPPRILFLGAVVAAVCVALWAAPSLLPSGSRLRMASFASGTFGHSERSRWVAIQGSLAVIPHEPFGTGLATFGRYINTWPGYPRQYPHNIVVEILLECGWAAGVALAVWILRGALNAFRSVHSGPGDFQKLYLLALVVFLASNSMTSGDINDNRLLFTACALAAMRGQYKALTGWSDDRSRLARYAPLLPRRNRPDTSHGPSESIPQLLTVMRTYGD